MLGGFQELGESCFGFHANSHLESCQLSLFLIEAKN
jgi:hypothetical protein